MKLLQEQVIMIFRRQGADAEVDRICHNKMFCNLYRRLKGRAVEL